MGLTDENSSRRCVVASVNSSGAHVSVHDLVKIVEAVVSSFRGGLGLPLGICRRNLAVDRPLFSSLFLGIAPLSGSCLPTVALVGAPIARGRSRVSNRFNADDLALLADDLDLAPPLHLDDDRLDAATSDMAAVCTLVVCDLLHNVKAVAAVNRATVGTKDVLDVLNTKLH